MDTEEGGAATILLKLAFTGSGFESHALGMATVAALCCAPEFDSHPGDLAWSQL